jgi:hypothetical protein
VPTYSECVFPSARTSDVLGFDATDRETRRDEEEGGRGGGRDGGRERSPPAASDVKKSRKLRSSLLAVSRVCHAQRCHLAGVHRACPRQRHPPDKEDAHSAAGCQCTAGWHWAYTHTHKRTQVRQPQDPCLTRRERHFCAPRLRKFWKTLPTFSPRPSHGFRFLRTARLIYPSRHTF